MSQFINQICFIGQMSSKDLHNWPRGVVREKGYVGMSF